MKKLLALISVLLITITLSGCTKIEQHDIYVTVYPMQYLAETIGGDTITVGRVPGSNVHSEAYDWSSKEILAMQNADYIFYVGANSDNYIPNNKEAIFDEGVVELVHIGDYVEYEHVCYESDHTHGEEEHTEEEHTEDEHIEDETCDTAQLSEDPHFWLDPNNMIVAADLVRDMLVAKYPENASLYNDNYMDLQLELEELGEAFDLMALEATKPIITTNMLFNYWHEGYGIEIFSLTADAHNDNTIPGDIIEFVEEAVFHDIEYILFELNSNSPSGDAVFLGLQEENPNAEKRYLHGLGTLSMDEIDDGEDYMSLMYKNLEVLNEATK